MCNVFIHGIFSRFLRNLLFGHGTCRIMRSLCTNKATRDMTCSTITRDGYHAFNNSSISIVDSYYSERLCHGKLKWNWNLDSGRLFFNNNSTFISFSVLLIINILGPNGWILNFQYNVFLFLWFVYIKPELFCLLIWRLALSTRASLQTPIKRTSWVKII